MWVGTYQNHSVAEIMDEFVWLNFVGSTAIIFNLYILVRVSVSVTDLLLLRTAVRLELSHSHRLFRIIFTPPLSLSLSLTLCLSISLFNSKTLPPSNSNSPSIMGSEGSTVVGQYSTSSHPSSFPNIFFPSLYQLLLWFANYNYEFLVVLDRVYNYCCIWIMMIQMLCVWSCYCVAWNLCYIVKINHKLVVW